MVRRLIRHPWRDAGGAGRTGVLRTLRGERGAQAVEFAMVMPLVLLAVLLLASTALLAADLVAVQTLARESARVAAVADDGETNAALRRAAGGRDVRLRLQPRGSRREGALVTATVELRSPAFRALGLDVWVPARARMRVEDST